MVQEWDNPAVAEFERQGAEERVLFAQSHTHRVFRGQKPCRE